MSELPHVTHLAVNRKKFDLLFDEVYLANESNLQIATIQNTEIADLKLELVTLKTDCATSNAEVIKLTELCTLLTSQVNTFTAENELRDTTLKSLTAERDACVETNKSLSAQANTSAATLSKEVAAHTVTKEDAKRLKRELLDTMNEKDLFNSRSEHQLQQTTFEIAALKKLVAIRDRNIAALLDANEALRTSTSETASCNSDKASLNTGLLAAAPASSAEIQQLKAELVVAKHQLSLEKARGPPDSAKLQADLATAISQIAMGEKHLEQMRLESAAKMETFKAASAISLARAIQERDSARTERDSVQATAEKAPDAPPSTSIMLDPEEFENLQNERDDFRTEVESLTSAMETMKADCTEGNERITFYKDKYETETAEVLRLLTRISTLETITVTLDSIDSLPPTNPDQYYAFYNDITLGELGTAIEKDQTAMDSNCPPDIIPSEADKFRPPPSVGPYAVTVPPTKRRGREEPHGGTPFPGRGRYMGQVRARRPPTTIRTRPPGTNPPGRSQVPP